MYRTPLSHRLNVVPPVMKKSSLCAAFSTATAFSRTPTLRTTYRRMALKLFRMSDTFLCSMARILDPVEICSYTNSIHAWKTSCILRCSSVSATTGASGSKSQWSASGPFEPRLNTLSVRRDFARALLPGPLIDGDHGLEP